MPRSKIKAKKLKLYNMFLESKIKAKKLKLYNMFLEFHDENKYLITWSSSRQQVIDCSLEQWTDRKEIGQWYAVDLE